MRKAELLVIGAQKAGTTALCRYLAEAPGIGFSRVKEVTYFVDPECYARGEAYYHGFFPAEPADALWASSYVHLLSCPEAPARVRDYNPRMRLVAILRDPVDRAWSAFNYARRNAWEPEADFARALALEPERRSGTYRERHDLAYVGNGLYAAHLARWRDHFPAENILVLTDRELERDPVATVGRALRHAGLEAPAEVAPIGRQNVAGVPRARWLNRLLFDKDAGLRRAAARLLPGSLKVAVRQRVLPRVVRLNTRAQANEPLDPRLRAALSRRFSEDLDRLEAEWGVDLRPAGGEAPP